LLLKSKMGDPGVGCFARSSFDRTVAQRRTLINHAFSKQKEGSRVANLFDLASRGVVERIKLPSRGPQDLNAFCYRRIELLSMRLLRGLPWRASPRFWVMYAREPLPFVSFEIIRIRPPAIVAVNHGAPDVVCVLLASPRAHPYLAIARKGNLRSLWNTLVSETENVWSDRIGLLAKVHALQGSESS
jgi:hypothetical protein